MKGLLLEDLYVMKKNLLIVLGMTLYFLCIIIAGSSKSTAQETDMVLYMICGLLPCFFTSCSIFTIRGDSSSKEYLFKHSLPLRENLFLAEKYLVTYILFCVSMLLYNMFFLFAMLMNQYIPSKNMLYISFLICAVFILIINIEIPLIFRFGQAIAAGLIISFICFFILLGLTVFVKINQSAHDLNLFKMIFQKKLTIFFILISLDVLSFIIPYEFNKIKSS